MLSFGGNPVGIQKRKFLKGDPLGRNIPALLYMAHILVGLFRLHPDDNHEGPLAGGGGSILKFRANIGDSMPLAAVPGVVAVLVPLFAVYGPQQSALALSISQSVKVFAGGKAVAQRIQNGGFAIS